MTNNNNKDKKISIIFGGMHGIAKNIASLFFKNGHEVIVIDKDIKSNSAQSFFHKKYECDLLSDKSVIKTIGLIKKENKSINNIIFCTRYRGDINKSWDSEIKLQLTSPKIIIEDLTPLLVKKDSSIIFVSSLLSKRVSLNSTVEYHVVKAGLESLTRFYAVKLGKKGIRVNAISPGYIIKNESLKYYMNDKISTKRIKAIHPLGVFGVSDDIAKVVYFMCSKDASFITGQIIVVDGGLSLVQLE
jgi:NAD(P)-dependent dehydrogenase (short-subunit alcohol dehydrogenase family)